MRSTLLGAICLTLAASIWGGMYVVSKYVLQYISPFPLLFMRYVVGVIVLGVVLWSVQRRQARRNVRPTHQEAVASRGKSIALFAWIGFIGYLVSVGCQFIGTKLSDAHTGALITSASPAFIVLFARPLLGERLSSRKLLSLVLSSIGVVIVIGWAVGGGLWGNVFLLLAAVTWALLSIYAKIASRSHSSLAVTTFALAFAMLYTTPIAIAQFRADEWRALSHPLVFWGVLYVGVVSTALAFFLWNKGMELLDAGPGSLFFFFQPVVGGFFGWLLLNEHLSWNFFIGGLFIVAGVALALLESAPSDGPSAPDTLIDAVE